MATSGHLKCGRLCLTGTEFFKTHHLGCSVKHRISKYLGLHSATSVHILITKTHVFKKYGICYYKTVLLPNSIVVSKFQADKCAVRLLNVIQSSSVREEITYWTSSQRKFVFSFDVPKHCACELLFQYVTRLNNIG